MPAKQKQEDDAGQAEAQERVDDAQDKGYIGRKVDPLPNSAHSLESGPDSPPQHEATTRADIADLKED